MMSIPLVSIIIPCYNVEHYIYKCLNSVVNQTIENIEIIVVNDGSIDNTLTIIQEFIARDSRIILIDKSNGGVSNARNDGISIAKGDYILFVDGDDYLEENACALLYSYAKDQNLDLLLFGKNIIKKDFIIKDSLIMNKSYYNSWQDYFDELRIIPSFPFCKFIKREVVINNSIYFDSNLILGEGLTYFIHTFPFCNNIGVIPNCLYNYIDYRPESATKSVSSRDITILETVKKMEKYALNANPSFSDSVTFKNTVFGIVASFVLYKYPKKGLFSKSARETIKMIKNDECFRKYLRFLAYSSPGLSKYKISSFMLLNFPILIFELFVFLIFKIQNVKNV